MSISAAAVAKDIFTIASGLKIAGGVVLHKLWSVLLGAEKKAKAEIAKLEADAAAAIKKV